MDVGDGPKRRGGKAPFTSTLTRPRSTINGSSTCTSKSRAPNQASRRASVGTCHTFMCRCRKSSSPSTRIARRCWAGRRARIGDMRRRRTATTMDSPSRRLPCRDLTATRSYFYARFLSAKDELDHAICSVQRLPQWRAADRLFRQETSRVHARGQVIGRKNFLSAISG